MYVRRLLPLLPLLPFLVSGCSTGPSLSFKAKHEPWRENEERACLSAGAVAQTHFIRSRSALGGPSVCGAARPFEVSAVADGRVAFKPAALLRCPMVPQVDRWVRNVVEPAARHYFGASVAEIKVGASYSCRPINHRRGAKLSEHGYANALDVSKFTLTNGRKITVKAGWYGAPEERKFLRDLHKGACREFTTVLGPHYDANHRDHFHLDLARRGRRGNVRVCK
jgi:hypothetical protein